VNYPPEALLVHVVACYPPTYKIVEELGEIVEIEKRPRGYTRSVRVRHVHDGALSLEKAHQLVPLTEAAEEILDMVTEAVGTSALACWRKDAAK
jgi:hypothetical protein